MQKQTKFLFFIPLIIVLLLAFWLRIDQLDALPPGLSGDEGLNVVDGFHMSQSLRYPFYESYGEMEPLYRYLMTISAWFFGSEVWSFRVMSVFVGTLTIAFAYDAMRQCVQDLKPPYRYVVALTAAGVLAFALGHITLSRALYRAIIQPLFMFMFIGFVLRGVRTGRTLYFAVAAAGLAGTVHSYTSGLVIPLAVFPFCAALLVFRWREWRIWLPRMILFGLLFLLLISPVVYYLLTDQERILSRVDDVQGDTVSLSYRLQRLYAQFVEAGDINPQYNVDDAPLVPRGFVDMFWVGFLALLIRLRQPSSWLIVAVLALSMVPVVAANEVPHGLRTIGSYAGFPLVIGAGVALMLAVIDRIPRVEPRRLALVGVLLIVGVMVANSTHANTRYTRYWQENTWYIFDRERSYGDWFFRQDKREMANWMEAQDAPILMPALEVENQRTRSWLIDSYPHVKTSDRVEIPPDTLVLIPYLFDGFGWLFEAQQFVLLEDETITILPPFTPATHADLLTDRETGPVIIRDNGEPLLTYYPLPDGFSPEYLPPLPVDPETVIANEEMRLIAWRGPDAMPAGVIEATFVLEWDSVDLPSHHYEVRAGIAGQDYNNYTSSIYDRWRWLFPPTIWTESDTAYSVHTFEFDPPLAPGAYRFLVGVGPSGFPFRFYPLTGGSGQRIEDEVVTDGAGVGWVKVAQPEVVEPPPGAQPLDIILADTFALTHATAERLEDGRVMLDLYWQSQVERPSLDATIFVHVQDSSGMIVAQDDQRPWYGQYPTFIWSAGERVRTQHLLDTRSHDLTTLELWLGMYTLPDVTRLTV